MSPIDSILPPLRFALAGRMILPGDAEYDAARVVVMGGIDSRPGVIVRPADAADVQLAVNVAREARIPFAIRSGGHSSAGHSTIDGGVVIDLRDMKRIDVDPAARRAIVEAGAKAGEVTAATLTHGLIVGFGDTASVGVGGITLGGGIGYLTRKFGLTIDSLLEAELVTADGALVTASATEHPELFWALRGGGGNFGVVTRFTYALNPLPEFTGGMICLPATPETIAGFIAAAEAAPDELSTIANVMPAPPMPFLPEDVVGKVVILAMLAYAGDSASAERAIAPFRALATPYADFVRSGDYMELMYPPEDPDYHPTATALTLFMDRVGLAEAGTILDTLEASDAVFRVAQLRVLGGAAASVPADATAYAHRASRIMVNVAAFYTTPEDRLKQSAFIARFAETLRQDDKGAYVNFIGIEPAERLAAAYPVGTLDRLRQVKRRWDPENLFRLNQNVAPADDTVPA